MVTDEKYNKVKIVDLHNIIQKEDKYRGGTVNELAPEYFKSKEPVAHQGMDIYQFG